MIHFACRKSLRPLAVATVGTSVWTGAMANDQSAIARTIKTAVAEVVAGINAHDPIKATAYDAPDVISMECGSPSTVGIEADREGFRQGFQHDPLWKVSLIDGAVDVAGSEALAVYHGTYDEDNWFRWCVDDAQKELHRGVQPSKRCWTKRNSVFSNSGRAEQQLRKRALHTQRLRHQARPML